MIPEAALSLIAASAAQMSQGTSPAATEVLAQIADFQKEYPKDSRVLPVKVAILIQAGQKEAGISTIESALSGNPPVSLQAFITLAQLSQTYRLNLEEACFTACQKAYGLTPELAFARARWLLSNQRTVPTDSN